MELFEGVNDGVFPYKQHIHKTLIIQSPPKCPSSCHIAMRMAILLTLLYRQQNPNWKEVNSTSILVSIDSKIPFPPKEALTLQSFLPRIPSIHDLSLSLTYSLTQWVCQILFLKGTSKHDFATVNQLSFHINSITACSIFSYSYTSFVRSVLLLVKPSRLLGSNSIWIVRLLYPSNLLSLSSPNLAV